MLVEWKVEMGGWMDRYKGWEILVMSWLFSMWFALLFCLGIGITDKMRVSKYSVPLFTGYGLSTAMPDASKTDLASSAQKHGWIPRFENLVAFGDR